MWIKMLLEPLWTPSNLRLVVPPKLNYLGLFYWHLVINKTFPNSFQCFKKILKNSNTENIEEIWFIVLVMENPPLLKFEKVDKAVFADILAFFYENFILSNWRVTYEFTDFTKVISLSKYIPEALNSNFKFRNISHRICSNISIMITDMIKVNGSSVP